MKHQAFLCLFLLLAGCARQSAVLDPPALIERGWNNYRLGEFSLAVRDFESALSALPGGDERRPMALYGLATVWSLRTPLTEQDKEKAASLYDEVLASAPRSDLAAWSTLALARIRHLVPVGEDPDYDEIRLAYRQVVERFPGHLAADEAFIYLQSTYAATLEQEPSRKAAADLEAFVKDREESGFLSAAYSLLAVCYETLDRPEDRLEAELKALETMEIDPSNPKQENSWNYWKIATIAEFEVGAFDTARTFYRRLIDEYPKDVRRYGAEQALARMDEVEKPSGGVRPQNQISVSDI